MKNYKIQTISILSAFMLYAPSAHAAPPVGGGIYYLDEVAGSVHYGALFTYDADNKVLTVTPQDPDNPAKSLFIGDGDAIYSTDVKKLIIGEGFERLSMVFTLPNVETVVIPDSMNVAELERYYPMFASMPANAKIYCNETSESRCNSLLPTSGHIQTYTKDENGVYDIDGTYYASMDNMTASTPLTCDDMANCLASIGTHCSTAEECQTLLDMSSEGTNCNSVSSCKTYLAEHPSAGNKTDSALIEKYNGTPLLYGKKIYTIQEAQEALSDGTKFHVGLTYK